jgi:hypothetical protein
MNIFVSLVKFVEYVMSDYPELKDRVLTLGTNFKNVDFSKPLIIVGLDTLINLGKTEKMKNILPSNVEITHNTMFSGNLSLDFHSIKDENMLAYEHAMCFCNTIKTQKAAQFFIDNPTAKEFSVKQVQNIINLNEISGANHIARFIANFNVIFWESTAESVHGCDAQDVFNIKFQN